MKKILDRNLSAMVQQVVNTIDPLQIILFGSQVIGNSTKDSDIDLLIVEQESFGIGRSRRKETAKVLKALIDFEVPKDILIYSMDEIKKFKNDSRHIIGQALKNGKILYDRS